MNLNTGYFAAYNHRHKQPTIGYRLLLNNQHSLRSSIESTNGTESFLPSINTSNGNNDGQRPYRRNDFANNHLFIAKQKLARIFHDQPTMNIQSRNNFVNIFDQHESKQRNRRINKNKRQENNSNSKSTPPLDQDVHLSIVNLIIKPSLHSSQTRDPLAAILHRRTEVNNSQIKAPRPSIEWTNPVIKQNFQLTSNFKIQDAMEPYTIINELIDNNPDIVNITSNPLDSSLLYVKSIIPSAVSQQR